MRVSVVTPSFNQAAFVTATLESVSSQTYANIEHIVVDPGSTDGSLPIIDAYVKRESRARAIIGQDKSQMHAINLGFAAADGDILCWLNSDDKFADTRVLEDVVSWFAANPDADVVYGRGDFISPEGEVIKKAFVHSDPTKLRSHLVNTIGILQPAVFMRRSAFERAGPLEQGMTYSFDYEYWRRLLESGATFKFIDRKIALAVIHTDAKTIRARDKSLEECVQVARRYYGFSPYEWLFRLADCKINNFDGIVNTSDQSSEAVAEAANADFQTRNGDAESTAAILGAAFLPSAEKSLSLVRERFSGGKWILTAFDAPYFAQGVTLMSGLFRAGHAETPKLVFDLGLEPAQKAFLSKLRNTFVVSFDKSAYDFPNWYFRNKNYVYKTFAMEHARRIAAPGDMILWIDAGVYPKQQLGEVFDRIADDDVFFVDHDDRSSWPFYNIMNTTNDCIAAIGATYSEALSPHLCSCLMGFKRGGQFERLFQEAFEHSLNARISLGEKHPPHREMLQPDRDRWPSIMDGYQRSTRKIEDVATLRSAFGYWGHRQDQSIFSIMAARHGAPLSSATKYCAADETSSRASKLNYLSGGFSSEIQVRRSGIDDMVQSVTVHHRGTYVEIDHLVQADGSALSAKGQAELRWLLATPSEKSKAEASSLPTAHVISHNGAAAQHSSPGQQGMGFGMVSASASSASPPASELAQAFLNESKPAPSSVPANQTPSTATPMEAKVTPAETNPRAKEHVQVVPNASSTSAAAPRGAGGLLSWIRSHLSRSNGAKLTAAAVLILLAAGLGLLVAPVSLELRAAIFALAGVAAIAVGLSYLAFRTLRLAQRLLIENQNLKENFNAATLKLADLERLQSQANMRQQNELGASRQRAETHVFNLTKAAEASQRELLDLLGRSDRDQTKMRQDLHAQLVQGLESMQNEASSLAQHLAEQVSALAGRISTTDARAGQALELGERLEQAIRLESSNLSEVATLQRGHSGKLATLRHDLMQAGFTRDALKDQFDKLSATVTLLSGLVEADSQSFNSSLARITATQLGYAADITQLRDALADDAKSREGIDREIKSLTSDVTKVGQRLDAESRGIDQSMRAISSQLGQLSTIVEEETVAVAGELTRQASAILLQEAEFVRMRDAFVASSKANATKPDASDIVALKTSLAAHQAVVATMASDISAVADNARTAKETVSQLAHYVSDTEVAVSNELARLSGSTADLGRETVALGQRIGKVDQRLTGVLRTDALDALRLEIADVANLTERAVMEVVGAIRQSDGQVAGLRSAHSEAAQLVAALGDRVDALRAQGDATSTLLDESIAKFGEDITGAREALAAFDKQTTADRELLTTVSGRVTSLEKNTPQATKALADSLDLKVASVKEALAAIEKQTAVDRERLTGVSGRVQSWEKSAAEAANALAGSLDAKLTSVAEAHTVFEKQTAADREQLTGVSSRVQSLEKSTAEATKALAGSLEAKLASVKEAHAALDKQTAADRERLTGVSGRVQSLEKSTAEATKALSGSLEAKLASVNEAQAAFEKQTTADRQQLAGVSGRVQSLEKSAADAVKALAATDSRLDLVKQDTAKIDDVAKSVAAATQRIGLTEIAASSDNARLFQRFNRTLRDPHITTFEKEWSRKLSMAPTRGNLGYMGTRAVMIERQLDGRLATSIEDVILRSLVARATKGKSIDVLEIGTLFGVGAAIMFDTLKNSYDEIHFTLLDPVEGYYSDSRPDILTGERVTERTLRQNMARAGMRDDQLTLIKRLSTDPMAIVEASQRQYDVLVIDADHSYAGVKADFENYARMVRLGGYIIFDDYASDDWPDVKAYVDAEMPAADFIAHVGNSWRTSVYRVVKAPEATHFQRESVSANQRKTTSK